MKNVILLGPRAFHKRKLSGPLSKSGGREEESVRISFLVLSLIVVIAGAASCGQLGVDPPTHFEEERLYEYHLPDCPWTNPATPCSATVRLCPDGIGDYRGLGSDIVESGSYRIFAGRVFVDLPVPERTVEFRLSDDGRTLEDQRDGERWELVLDAAEFCG